MTTQSGFDFTAPSALRETPAVSAPGTTSRPCTHPAIPGRHVCRVGGGLAVYTDDNARTWFCHAHAAPSFFGRAA